MEGERRTLLCKMCNYSILFCRTFHFFMKLICCCKLYNMKKLQRESADLYGVFISCRLRNYINKKFSSLSICCGSVLSLVKFYSPLFQGTEMYGNEFGINESKIYTKNKIEPQHIYMMCIIRLFIAFLLLRHVVDTIFSSPFFQQNLTKRDLVKQYLRSNGQL